MSFFAKTLFIHAPIERVWAALTQASALAAWMGGEMQSDPHPGGSYAFFDDQITGDYTLVEAPYRLECTWRRSTWRADWADSNVRWRLRRLPDGVDLQLVHDHFPKLEECQKHAEDWSSRWLSLLKTWLEQETPG